MRICECCRDETIERRRRCACGKLLCWSCWNVSPRAFYNPATMHILCRAKRTAQKLRNLLYVGKAF
jgi:hypothetical protein